jgi:hypothetical protein
MDQFPRPEHPRPLLRREPWLNLNGKWEFGIGEGEPDGLIMVPFPPESMLSGVGVTEFMPLLHYRRTFTIPWDPAGNRTLIHFGAVDYEARVWLNGVYLGSHRGGYTPFSFDISAHLSTENELSVEARDDNRSGLQPCGKQSQRPESHGCRYKRVTGIWQTVWLEAVGQTQITSVSVGDPEGKRLLASVDLDPPRRGEVLAEVKREGITVGSGRCPASRYAQVPIEMDEAPALWEPGEASIYDLDLRISENGETLDKVSTYFGLRRVEVKGDSFLINGRRVFQRLVLDQGYYPDGVYTAPNDDALRHDIEISMEMGFNGARLHQKVFEPRFLYWADRLGYLVWAEFPSWGLNMGDPEACRNFIAEWSQAVTRDMNHPSIIGWCPFNETPVDQNVELVRAAYHLAKTMDPTRPVIDTSGYTHVVTDLYDSHDYDQDVEGFQARHRSILTAGRPYQNHPEDDSPYEGQPVWVSEFGGTWWNPDQTGDEAWGYGERPRSVGEFLERYRGLASALLENHKIVGFCYTQLHDIEQEVNGLHTYERVPKFRTEEIRQMNSALAAYEEAQER